MNEPGLKIFSEEHNYTRLFEIATPQLYRKNSLRILGLPVDATMKDIKQRKNQTEMMRKLGTSLTNENIGYLKEIRLVKSPVITV